MDTSVGDGLTSTVAACIVWTKETQALQVVAGESFNITLLHA